MLGQHVIMEEDTGETEEKTGLWIPNYYVVSDDETNTYYVWSCDDNQKVCKKEISVGEIDEEMLEYQILDGLTEDDYIAFPDELTQEGTFNCAFKYDWICISEFLFDDEADGT